MDAINNRWSYLESAELPLLAGPEKLDEIEFETTESKLPEAAEDPEEWRGLILS